MLTIYYWICFDELRRRWLGKADDPDQRHPKVYKLITIASLERFLVEMHHHHKI